LRKRRLNSIRGDKIFYRARMVIHPDFQNYYLQQNGYLPGELQP